MGWSHDGHSVDRRDVEPGHRVHAREAFRTVWPGTAFVVEQRTEQVFVARSPDGQRRATVRWFEGAAEPAEVEIRDGARGSAIAADAGFTSATVKVVRFYQQANGDKL